MTRPDLDALAALLDKATPGPFYWFMRECVDKDALMVELAAVVDKTVAVNGYNLHGVGAGEPEPDADYLAVAHTGCGPRSPINAQLIVAAVNALPALLAYVRELERDREAAALAMRERCAQACDPPICGSQGFAGPSCCILPPGHEGAHKYGEPRARTPPPAPPPPPATPPSSATDSQRWSTPRLRRWEGVMRKLSDKDHELRRLGYANGYGVGYAAGYRAAQAAMPPREPTQAMIAAGLSHDDVTMIWHAMHDAWTQEQTSGGTQQRPEQANASKPESRHGPLDHQSAATPSRVPRTGAAQAATDGPAADRLTCMSHGYEMGELCDEPADCARNGCAKARQVADPIADLCDRLRMGEEEGWYSRSIDAAYEIDRLTNELADARGIAQACEQRAERTEADLAGARLELATLRAFYGDQHIRDRLAETERLTAERDALRECVRAADAVRTGYMYLRGLAGFHAAPLPEVLTDYDAARTKVPK